MGRKFWQCRRLKFLGSFPLQPIPENKGYDNQDEKEADVAAMKGLRCEVKREDAKAK
jgi:hypothetical protein